MKIGSFDFPEQLVFDNHTMRLNGGGERVKFFVKLYAMSFYSSSPILNSQEAIKSDIPRCVRMVLTTPLVTNSLLSESIFTGYKRSTNNNIELIKDYINSMLKALTSTTIKYGDYFDIVYTPEVGMSFYKNDEFLGGGNKDSFMKESTFAIWLADNTSDLGLRKKMLKGF